jgi:hypothetical protein
VSHRSRSQSETRVVSHYKKSLVSRSNCAVLSHFGLGSCVSLLGPPSVVLPRWPRHLCLMVSGVLSHAFHRAHWTLLGPAVRFVDSEMFLTEDAIRPLGRQEVGERSADAFAQRNHR